MKNSVTFPFDPNPTQTGIRSGNRRKISFAACRSISSRRQSFFIIPRFGVVCKADSLTSIQQRAVHRNGLLFSFMVRDRFRRTSSSSILLYHDQRLDQIPRLVLHQHQRRLYVFKTGESMRDQLFRMDAVLHDQSRQLFRAQPSAGH